MSLNGCKGIQTLMAGNRITENVVLVYRNL